MGYQEEFMKYKCKLRLKQTASKKVLAGELIT